MNSSSSEQFPPRPNFDARRTRLARARTIRLVFLSGFVVVGVVMVLLHRYTFGLFLLAWGVLRMGMLIFAIMRRRRRAREWGSS
jgi:hypothetical protein